MNEEQARQFIRALFHFVWEKRDKSKIPTFYAASLTGFVDQVPLTIRDIYNGVDYLAKNLASNKYSLHDLIVSGNKIAVVINAKAVSVDEESERYTSIAYFFELAKGKIIKMRMYPGVAEVKQINQDDDDDDENASFISKAVDAVSNLAKPKKPKKPKKRPSTSNNLPPERKEPPQRKQANEKSSKAKQLEEEHKAARKKLAAEEKMLEEERRKGEERRRNKERRALKSKQDSKSTTDYAASPQPAFSFNKAKLQVGVTPKDTKPKKDD
ncbi:MAG: hypothetical protein P1U34_03200 [Coxiellaceae bacterium]|nr:hypothetical protein [Coxiellaceae bacterium]